MRNINQELAPIDLVRKNKLKYFPKISNKQILSNKLFHEKFLNRPDIHKMIRCVDCGKRIWSDVNLIQRHYLSEHKILYSDSAKKREAPWKFQEAGLRNDRVC